MSHPRRIAALVGAAALFTFAAASPAMAYPDPDVNVSVGGDILVGGGTVTFSASSGDTPCSWSADYPGTSIASGSGTSYSGTVQTPVVDTRTDTTLTVYCEYEADPDVPLSLGSASEVTAADTAQASATTTLLPDSGVAGEETDLDDNGSGSDGSGVAGVSALLPDTGAPAFWALLGGAALVVVGGGAFVASRRRES